MTAQEQQLIKDLLRFAGEDPTREGLQETPQRFLNALKFWTAGYLQDPAAVSARPTGPTRASGRR